MKNREKAVIIDAIRDRYSLPMLLNALHLSKSSYYYQEAAIQKEDKYVDARKRVIEIFHENKKRYGYRLIHGILRKEGVILSEKVSGAL